MASTVHRFDIPARRMGKTATDEARNRLYRAVRAACRRLGIDEDERKSIQLDVIGKLSMTDMTVGEIGRLLDRLNKDWSGPMGHRAHVGKIRALWWTLYWLGEIDSTHDSALDAFVQRQTCLSALRFLDHRKAPAVIEALKSWAERAGVIWPTPEDTAEVREAIPNITTAQHERIAVLSAIGRQLEHRGALEGDGLAFIARALGLRPNPIYWSVHELDAGIRRLGRTLRKLKG